MTEAEELRRADRAQELMSDPLMVEAFETIEGGLVSAMRRVALGDEKAHRELIYMLQVVGSVKQHLEQIIATGKMVRLKADESRTEKLLRRVVG